jgi:hypothetical protein
MTKKENQKAAGVLALITDVTIYCVYIHHFVHYCAVMMLLMIQIYDVYSSEVNVHYSGQGISSFYGT